MNGLSVGPFIAYPCLSEAKRDTESRMRMSQSADFRTYSENH